MSYLSMLEDWSHGGINFSLPGEGGPTCLDHVSSEHRTIETAVGLGSSLIAFYLGFRSHKPVPFKTQPGSNFYGPGRIFLLTTFSFIFGMEVCYKFATKSLIFLLNPCHVLSVCQIALLALPASKLTVYLYRFVLHFTLGPAVAIAFPVTATLFLPFEPEVYWIQHYLLVIVPAYMMHSAKEYSAHPPMSLSWICMSYGIWGIWHWGVMQGVSVLTLANVGSMLCPAESDPFHGPFYRVFGIFHQFLGISLMGTFTAKIAGSSVSVLQEDVNQNERKTS